MGFRQRERKRKAKDLFARKQELAAPARYYGDGGTIHGSGTIDIVMGTDGYVQSVWFRCQQLPFQVSKAVAPGATSTLGYGYRSTEPYLPTITGIEVLDRE